MTTSTKTLAAVALLLPIDPEADTELFSLILGVDLDVLNSNMSQVNQRSKARTATSSRTTSLPSTSTTQVIALNH